MGMGYSVLDWVCIGTAVLASVPPFIGAVTNLWRGQLGAADRRPEPTVAALLANASWFMFGQTENLVEPLRLNAVGGGAQVTALVAFLVLTDHPRAHILIIPVTLAGFYYVAVLGVGFSHLQVEVYQSLCAFAGMLSSAAPLLTFRFLLDGPIEQFLPQWWLLFFYMAHGFVWCVRALTMEPQNPYMLSQNVVLAFCSGYQLFLALRALHANVAIDQDPHGLLQGLLPHQPAQEQLQAGQDQLPHVQEQLPAADDAQQPDNDEDPHGEDHADHDAHNDDEPNDEDADGDGNPNDEDVHDDAEDDDANGDNHGEDVHDDAEDDDANGDNHAEDDDANGDNHAEDDDANGDNHAEEVHDDAEDDNANGDNHGEDDDAHSDDDGQDDDDHGDHPAHGDEPNNDDEQPAAVDANNLLIAGGDDQNVPIPGGDDNNLLIPVRRSRRIAAIAAARARAAAAAADH